MSQTPSHILENLRTALPAVANAVKGGWDNIQNFAIKTNSSVSLPIWSCTLTTTDRRQTEDAEEGDEDLEKEEEEEEEEEEEMSAKEQASRKGRKRVTNFDIEGVEKPRKRSKGADGMVRTGISISKKVEKEEEAEDEDEDEDEEEEELAAKELASRKGSKRVKFSGEEIEGIEKSRKRSKAADGMIRGVSTSKKEMRRSVIIGEKRKKIALISKGSKSAVLGKKVGTSQIHP